MKAIAAHFSTRIRDPHRDCDDQVAEPQLKQDVK